VFLLSFVGFNWGIRALGSFDMFGTGQIVRHLRSEEPPQPMPFTIRGPYRWVRHPLYLFCLLMIWSCPNLTVDRLLYNVMWTGWVILGTLLEERDLIACFGEAYHKYQKKVPMLIPRSIRPASSVD
jgi:protein-S-isoprenylcysteine O-methyltransferase Ste14